VLHPLFARNRDLDQLSDDDYEVEIFNGNQLVVRSIPYVNSQRQVRRGVLISTLNLNGDVTNPPEPHTVLWAGEFPCNVDGQPLERLRHGECNQRICDEVTAKYSFSNKPPGGYRDYHQQVTNYVGIISGPAEVLEPGATPRTGRVLENSAPESVFLYADTASSRAGIMSISRKLETGPLAIVGVGGSGVYVLDFIAKTLVPEIHVFDPKRFSSHNAFRGPGAASIEELRRKLSKVAHWAGLYSRMRRRVIPHEVAITAENVHLLDTMSFVFICLDSPRAKKVIVEHLLQRGIAFVDVGMGLTIGVDESLAGTVRVTTATAEKHDHLGTSGRMSFEANGDDVYEQNIQTPELNAMNAALAVIKWKKLLGFYADLRREYFSAYTVEGNMLINEDIGP